jgi:hypothetical protein
MSLIYVHSVRMPASTNLPVCGYSAVWAAICLQQQVFQLVGPAVLGESTP